MAYVRPYRFARFTSVSADVVAPPYDVLDDAARAALAARSPHNVVHLTLNPSEEEAGALFRSWLSDGTLTRDPEPAVWFVAQDYVGPDGVARTRRGIVASLGVEPYETRVVLPHERTHAGPKESRLRLLRAAQAQIEPIFLLYDGEPPVVEPSRVPDVDVDGTRLWRVPDAPVEAFFAERQLLIADGHHRYETAVAYAAEVRDEAARRMMVVLVSTSDPGLEIFPTHRLFSSRPDIDPAGDEFDGVDAALAALAQEGYDTAAAVFVRGAIVRLVRGAPDELDVELVDRYGHEGIAYTADLADARARLAGDDVCGFLLRATRIEDVFERARRGHVMPQKTTYFYPKLLSGLLFHPLAP